LVIDLSKDESVFESVPDRDLDSVSHLSSDTPISSDGSDSDSGYSGSDGGIGDPSSDTRGSGFSQPLKSDLEMAPTPLGLGTESTQSPQGGDSTSKVWKPSVPSGRRHFSLKGNLSHFPRYEASPNFLELSPKYLGPILREWGNTLYCRIMGRTTTESFLLSLVKMINFLKTLQASEGSLYVLKYMKVSYLYCVGYLSGQKHSNSWIFGTPVGLSGGLPTWIPAPIRLRLRSGDLRIWRWTLSFLFSYKGLMVDTPEASLATIVADPWDSKEGLPPLESAYKAFATTLRIQYGDLDLSKLETKNPPLRGDPKLDWQYRLFGIGSPASKPPLFSEASQCREILTSGPNGRPSVVYAGLDALAWLCKGNKALETYLKLTKNWHLAAHFKIALADSAKYLVLENDRKILDVPTTEDVQRALVPCRSVNTDTGKISVFLKPVRLLLLGRLALKPEAAGKIRVFAIIDYWTQCALYPLHKLLVEVLSSFTSDATKDQSGAFKAFVESQPSEIVSYDLSSATDIMPIELQTRLLSELFGAELGAAWENLIRDREFGVPKGTTHTGRTIRYTRGQPMGALSSWAIIALTHHFLVFVAASRVGETCYSDYVICGDDIALAGSKVPPSYQALCFELGIPISLPKSLKSKTSDRPGWGETGPLVSFVSRLSLGTCDVTPWSLKEEVTVESLGSRLESICRRFERGQALLNNSWLCTAAKMAVTRLSDVKRVSECFTSGEMSDSLKELLAPLLFPSSRSIRAFGLKGGDLSLWLAILEGRPGITSLGATALKEGLSYPKDFPLGSFVDELFIILWSRVISVYDTASANTRLFYDWICTARNCRRTFVTGSAPWSVVHTYLLSSTALRTRITSDQIRINRIVTQLRSLIASPAASNHVSLGDDNYLVVARQLTLPTYPAATLDEKLKALCYALDATEDMPNPTLIQTIDWPTLRSSVASGRYIPKKNLIEASKDIFSGALARDSYPIHVDLKATFQELGLPQPLESLTLGPGWIPESTRKYESVDPWSCTNTKELFEALFDFEDRTSLVSQLPDFPAPLEPEEIIASKGSNLGSSTNAMKGLITWDNPLYLGNLTERIGSERYVQHLISSQNWFIRSQFRSFPWPPATTRGYFALNPFVSKEIKQKTFGLSRPGLAFNRVIDLLRGEKTSQAESED